MSDSPKLSGIIGHCDLTRRRFLKLGTLAVGSVTFGAPAWGQTPATIPATMPSPHAILPRAKSMIQLWMGGGPSHLDTFDPKPEAGEDYCGPLNKPIATNVPGIRIGQLLPLLAQQADKYSIIRSLTHGNNGHETATYIVQTGTMPSAELVYPAFGAVVAYKRQTDGAYKGMLPPYISVTSALGRFSEA